METVSDIRDSGLCTQCGTCVALCPFNAIKMIKSNSKGIYLPLIDRGACKNCGFCVKCCPGHFIDLKEMGKFFDSQHSDIYLGKYLSCWVAHANDYKIRYNSASGGIATQLLVFMLEKRLIDGALVIKMNEDCPLEPLPIIAKTKQEIIYASKSKYCPVSANVALKQVLKEDGRFAVVGLPCHIHGIRKAELLNTELRKKIVLHVSLMCSHSVNFSGTEFILKKLHIPKEQVSSLSYRGKGWPGAMTIKLENKCSFSIPLVGSWNSYWPIFSSFFFTPIRCTLCPDQTGELADISLGDAWLPEFKSDKIGKSIIITRAKTAESLLSEMASSKLITLMKVSPEKVKQSQLLNLKFKKDDLGTRLRIIKFFGKQVPQFVPTQSSWSLAAFLRAIYIYFNIKVSSSKRIASFLNHLPFPFFRLYFGIYKLLCLI
jgi:coenzyme F420 hydrogenase subunit beta